MISCFVRLLIAAVVSLAIVRAQPPAQPAATAAPAAAKPEDDMLQKLLLPDADIDSVLNTLELLTGRSVLRPASLPTVTYNIKINKPIPKSEAVLAIETVLALNGVGVAPQGDKFLVITGLNMTRTSAPEMITGSAFDQPPSGKPATKIFTLDFLRVQEVAGVITQILNPNYGGAVQFPNANAILVTDSVSNLQRVEMLLQQIDKPALAGMKPKFYPLKYTKASDVVGKMRTILGGTLQQQLGQGTTYSADDGGAQIVVVSDPRLHPLFDDLIAKLDVKSNPFTKNDVIYLKHADAQQVATLLQQLVTGQNRVAQQSGSTSLRPGMGMANVNNPAPNVPVVPGAPTPAIAPTAAPNVESLLGSTTTEFSTFVTAIPDIRSNAIVVSGTPSDISLINTIVEKLDIILAQVRIEVVIAEVLLDDQHTSGISQLGLNVAGDKLTGFSGTASGVQVGAGSSSGLATISPVQISKYADLTALLSLTTTPRKSDTTILSVPSITTTHNKEATFFFGETRPVVSGVTSTPTAAATTSSGFSTSSQVNQQEIGTNLVVKPLIGNDGSVQLDIKQQITDVTGTVQIDNNTQYIIGKRTTNSFITAQSGEVLVLGGIQRKKETKSNSRLGPIPIIGDLFGARNKESQRTEVLFFIRPVVLTNTAADNTPALDRVKDLPDKPKDEIMKQVDPAYQPAKKPFFHLTK